MLVLSWNTRGLCDPDMRLSVKLLIQTLDIDMICLQKTLIANPSHFLLRALGVNQIDNWIWVNSVGFSGGVFMGWNSRVLTKIDALVGNHSISISLKIVKIRVNWVFTGLYIPALAQEKAAC